MLDKLQIISFEVTNRCNMSPQHPWCPSNRPERYQDKSNTPDPAKMMSFLDLCIEDGFKGYVGFHYFCEPTLDLVRCEQIRQGVFARGLKTVLWTNGSLPHDSVRFDAVFRTQYDGSGNVEFRPDDRIHIYDTDPIPYLDYRTCWRPWHTELVIDYYGSLHLCCADWRADAKSGNINIDDPRTVLNNFYDIRKLVMLGGLDVCRRCQGLRNSPVIYDRHFRLDLEGANNETN